MGKSSKSKSHGGKKSNNTNEGKKTHKLKLIDIDLKNFQWIHKNSVDYCIFFSETIFRNPDILSKTKKGIAIWYPKSNEKIKIGDELLPNIFAEHWCRDESIKHDCPAKHEDFFYSFIKINLNNKNWSDVLAISGSIGYDPLKKLLYARCGSIEANIATLYTCMLVNNGIETIDNIHKNKLYGKNIKSTQDSKNVINMYNFLLNNLPKNVPLTGYWDIAFPNYSKTKKC